MRALECTTVKYIFPSVGLSYLMMDCVTGNDGFGELGALSH